MSTLVPDRRHPALDIEPAARIEYLTVVASIAYADLQASDSELDRLRDLSTTLEVELDQHDALLQAARTPAEVEVERIVARLADSDLRHALLVDAIDLAYADRVLEPREREAIERIADRLGVPRGQLALIRRYVAGHRVGEPTGSSGNLVASIVAVGVPIAAFGLTQAAGASLAASGAVAAATAVISFAVVKLLFRKS